jgi:hypothetical protein
MVGLLLETTSETWLAKEEPPRFAQQWDCGSISTVDSTMAAACAVCVKGMSWKSEMNHGRRNHSPVGTDAVRGSFPEKWATNTGRWTLQVATVG